MGASAMSALPGVEFECRTVSLLTFVDTCSSYRTVDEADAVAWARANVTPRDEQISIEAHAPGDVSTFAIRHFHLHRGTVVDSGWSCWKDGTKVSTTSLDALFASPPRLFAAGVE